MDLDTLPPEDRVDAFHHAMNDASVPNDIVHESPESGIRARFETWRVGGLDLFDVRSTGFEVRRTAKHVRWHRDRPVVSVSLQTSGTHRAENAGERYVLGPDDIGVFHELTPRRYGWAGDGASWAVTIDMEHLGVPVDTVVQASVRLRASPLHDLVLAHLRSLRRDPGLLEADPGAAALGNATTDLVRALLTSAAHPADDRRVRAAMDDSLAHRILAYTRRHLTEPDLTPDRIARAHCISKRQLYTTLGQAGIRLEQWVISERLEAACRLLASPQNAGLPVSAVAARSGFTSPSHFTRRFRDAYGTTPREWRRHRNQGTPRPGPAAPPSPISIPIPIP
ncbi:AraC family transcriptional regulator [Streptomyces sp. F8]|uniref:helix-turn-helix domain-containing protein n=1 Tax=Streptomyces sp. F8 TaxID=1436085 RepID=UPI0029CFD888|nr:AraC family transcriptional regulator [Streptomyces sp. F8]MDX6761522.1 AraC family transcriptional regulator [Streptomyces sp. F8]